jgi:cardiolipin synthase
MKKIIPNALSVARLVLSFVLIPLILNKSLTWAIILFAIAAISDFLDGYLARKFRASSALGALLDPLADKVLMTIVYALLAGVNFIPLYLAIIVIGRDILILSAVTLCKFRSIDLEIRPITSSKINTGLQLVFIILVLACNNLAMNVPYLLEICGMVVCVSTVFSGAEYVRKYYWIKNKTFNG